MLGKWFIYQYFQKRTHNRESFQRDTTTENGCKKRTLYMDNNHLVINYFSLGKSRDVEAQLELLLNCLHWITDSIVNGFWKRPSEGGFKNNLHTVEASFDEERILISRSMNAGEYEKKGFKFTNKPPSPYN